MSFIAIEGGEGSGKSTLMKAFSMEFSGHSLVFVREPGSTELGEEIRTLLVGRKMISAAEFFLFLSAGIQLAEEIVIPALKAGRHIICDRYRASTYAYQIVGRNRRDLSKTFWEALELFPIPDLYIHLVVPPEIGLKRKKKSGEVLNRFDEDTLDFHRRVEAGYDEYFASIESSGSRVRRVDARMPEEEVYDAVIDDVTSFIGLQQFALSK